MTVAIGQRRTAAVVVIGNEVLSAKVSDANGPQILQMLRDAGVKAGELAILPDEPARIAAVVREFAGRFDLVITTGGVGPTHDDCTWRSVGEAFGAPMVFHPDLAQKLSAHVGAELTPEQQRLAWLPQGAEMVPVRGRWPLFRLANVYVLPGVPALVAKNLRQIAELLAQDRAQAPQLATAYFTLDEWHAVAHIDAVVAAFGDVEIGSYPVYDAADYRLRLTFEHADRARVQAAADAAVQAIGAEQLVRIEWREPAESGAPWQP